MKRIIPALIAALLVSGSAYAQSLSVGPGGIAVDPRPPRERLVDREIRRDERARERNRYERRRDYRAERRGDRCRTVTTTEETRRGTVRRTSRVCG